MQGDPEWSAVYADVVDGECSRCGLIRPVRWVADPFVAEVYPEDKPEPEPWCYPCWLDCKGRGMRLLPESELLGWLGLALALCLLTIAVAALVTS